MELAVRGSCDGMSDDGDTGFIRDVVERINFDLDP